MGKLFDKLENKRELEVWINTYAGFNDTNFLSPTVSLEYLMRCWDSAKENLYNLLDNQIIYEKQISYERPESQLIDDMHDFVFRGAGRVFKSAFSNWLDNWYWDNYENLGDREAYTITSNLKYLVQTNTLITNRYDGSSFKIKIGTSEIAVPFGCKATKALGKIAAAANIKGWEEFRIAHSRVLNQKKLTGTLCLSIHPLDYFTMSDNEYGWDSCMNWRSAGCYRMGTVEMCNSPYVVVAYLKGDKEMRFYDKTWNSKKWRNLFIVTHDIITGIKGYPYQSKVFDESCIKILKELAEKNLGWHYDDEIYEHGFDSPCEEVCLGEDFYCDFNFDTNIMYNDFGNSNTTHFILAPGVDNINVYYSGHAECMCCGEILDGNDIEDAEFVICSDCCVNTYCDDCGSRISGDNVYELDGVTLCENCYYDNRVYDAITDEEHHASNCIDIYLAEDGEDVDSETYHDFTGRHSHITVYNDESEFKGYFPYPHYTSLKGGDGWYAWTENVYYVYTSECTEEGLTLFKRYGEQL